MLSILCITKVEPFTAPFLYALVELGERTDSEVLLVADGMDAFRRLENLFLPRMLRIVESKGYLESALEQAIAFCAGDYILRIDDDEKCSPALAMWLEMGGYEESDHWKFPRMHLWPDVAHYITSAPLWPDVQTRLSTKAKSGGRTTVHAGSPYGGGTFVDLPIEHHKFLVRSEAERTAIGERYDALLPGAGIAGGMRDFQLPNFDTMEVALV